MKSLESKNEDFEFELHIKGKVHVPHYTEVEEKLKCAREILESMRDVLEEKGYNTDLDFDIKENFSEVW